MSETVLVENANGVRTLTLHRPSRRNALTAEMQDELIAAVEAAGEERECRVVVLTGGDGEVFCAGLDLKALAAMAGHTPAQHRADAERVALMFRTLYECPKPTIAAVHGAAIGGGAGLATICDFTIAAPAAWFAFTEVKIGFVPAIVSAYLVLQVGEKRARDLLLTGRQVNAEEAYRMGLVNELAPRGALMERAQALALTLIKNSPESLRLTKALLAAQSKPWLDAAVADAMAANAAARATADFQEGVAAFLEKRTPVWGKR
jgi:methylglutaconyl-CoA hydratase